ncbi:MULTISPECIES: mannose-1-phosphate guanylyltransferase/mannose-6-phosphate isomerase [Pseudomonas]|uniref:mannose-1-phosphate guanylyltransferase/mannose-6-phosphate isomerase n=1 Tax=Pseudomonas guariconensis TaxID=1288410 RepID=UPI00209774F2|nr:MULTISPECIES: mannose-1-phosphate guanylyltransferase/mannose-6-phosphate isomerase [Pseudomonas]MCO7596023.1 mannose-1-phosphate guanylyltransferase/mannose-6-phosphate isomerase [Pseudomonas guariconensis]MCU7222211.1 mannose-1-phosphate guanylyltransferase/mannose-6-phosphate isomerase [Pseudomonas brassicacearum]
MIPVILSGGSGSRLWPLSRALHPKQFLNINAEQSLFQTTLTRLEKVVEESISPIIVSNEDHRFLVAEQCRALGVKPSAILLESIGRNTAPAIAAATLTALSLKKDELLLVLPADHDISDLATLKEAFQQGVPEAESGRIVTFGITPDKPETGYGYIRVEEKGTHAQAVAAFVEKPDLETAQQYLNDGRYFWNSGMFLFKASTMLTQLQKYAPDVLNAVDSALSSVSTDLDFQRLDPTAFAKAPDISIDYAVMEKSDIVTVVPLDAGWNDIGSWSAVWEIAEKDDHGNASRGDVILEDTVDAYVHAEHRLVSVLGLKDVVVVETADAVMVAAKDKAQDVKKLVDTLKKNYRSEATSHRKVYRPWGAYDSIDASERYQVKRITVAPGQKLSVQMHHHRAEHWIVVTGTAKVTIGGDDLLLTENQSTYIPVGVVHALENPGKIPLEMIEVQSGSYLGEDDIVRFSDRYGRVTPLEATAS